MEPGFVRLFFLHQLTGFSLRSVAVATALAMSGTALAGVDSPGHETSVDRTLTLLQESLMWISRTPENPGAAPGSGTGQALPQLPARAPALGPVIPLSSAPAREQWVGQKFFLNGEDHEALESDRVRFGFETEGIPGVSRNLAIEYNWSMSQQPGDTTMDLGFAWNMPWQGNQVVVRGRFHEYEDEVISGDSILEVGGDQQTLEIDLSRNLYTGQIARLDAGMVVSDVTNRWYENGDQTDESRSSYSLFRINGQVGGEIPILQAHGDLQLSLEGCVGLVDSLTQNACGERLGAFQRYNLSGELNREWLDWLWGVEGQFQYSPDELPSWRYLQVGSPSMMHGFNGQSLYGREGGWLRLNTESPLSQLWIPSGVYSSVRFSLLQGWADGVSGTSDQNAATSAAEVLWRISGDRLSAGVQAGTLLSASGPGCTQPDFPDVSMNVSFTL